jgi:hypothetical protein
MTTARIPDRSGYSEHPRLPGESADAFSSDLTAAQIAEEAAARHYPEWDSAIKANTVSFDMVCEAMFGSEGRLRYSDPVTRAVYARYYPLVLEGFQNRHGNMISRYFCSNVIAAATYTDKDELYVVSPMQQLDLEDLLFRAESLSKEALRTLNQSSNRRVCIEKFYSIATHALGIYDKWYDHHQDIQLVEDKLEPIPFVRSQLEEAEEYYRQAAHREAHKQYFFGMLAGLALLIPVGTIAGVALHVASISGLVLEPILGALIAGGLGAVVSVMTRMTRGTLVLRFESGRFLLRLLGIFRPFMGAILGLALYLLLRGTILPVAIPEEAEQLYFFAGIAFIAGFSERWAQDMLVVSENRATPGHRADGAAT